MLNWRKLLSLFEILNIRFSYEEIVKKFTLPSYDSDINNIEWFLEYGHKSNSLRNGYGDAVKYAQLIKEYADGCSKEIKPGL